MRRALLIALTLVSCATPPPPEQLGVEIFAEDTVPVRFTVSVSGGLQMRVEAERSYIRADSSLVFETPAKLIVHKGVGTSLVSALNANDRFAVQPAGLSPDSTDGRAVVGNAIQVTRERGAARLQLKVERP